jgi:hypothetical protein
MLINDDMKHHNGIVDKSYIKAVLDSIDSDDRLKTQLYDKRDDFNFPIVNFPFICSNIPAVSTY